MEEKTFLVFLLVISIGILFIGSGITGLYSVDIDNVGDCNEKSDCGYGKVCCGFQEGDNVFRICAEDCRSVTLSEKLDNNQNINGFNLDISGSSVKEIKSNSDYWIFILIGAVLVLLAFFYRQSHHKIISKVSNKRKG